MCGLAKDLRRRCAEVSLRPPLSINHHFPKKENIEKAFAYFGAARGAGPSCANTYGSVPLISLAHWKEAHGPGNVPEKGARKWCPKLCPKMCPNLCPTFSIRFQNENVRAQFRAHFRAQLWAPFSGAFLGTGSRTCAHQTYNTIGRQQIMPHIWQDKSTK